MRRLSRGVVFGAVGVSIIAVGAWWLLNMNSFSLTPTEDPNDPNRVVIPKDLEAALTELDHMLPEALIDQMRGGSESEMARFHDSLGRWMRNNWGLWGGSVLARSLSKIGLQHPDDMSGVILTSYWRRLHHVPINVEAQVAKHKAYWDARARPPATKCPSSDQDAQVRSWITDDLPDGGYRTWHIADCGEDVPFVYERSRGWHRADANLQRRIGKTTAAP